MKKLIKQIWTNFLYKQEFELPDSQVTQQKIIGRVIRMLSEEPENFTFLDNYGRMSIHRLYGRGPYSDIAINFKSGQLMGSLTLTAPSYIELKQGHINKMLVHLCVLWDRDLNERLNLNFKPFIQQ